MGDWYSNHATGAAGDAWGDGFTPAPVPTRAAPVTRPTDDDPTRRIVPPPGPLDRWWEYLDAFAAVADEGVGPALAGILWCPRPASCPHPGTVRFQFGYLAAGEADPTPVSSLVGWLSDHWGCRREG